MRGETSSVNVTLLTPIFQSTPLMRGETSTLATNTPPDLFQSTPLMRGETTQQADDAFQPVISIHSPHTRGDRPSAPEAPPANYFNPLPSHERRHPVSVVRLFAVVISIHSPHARGDSISLQKSIRIYVSLHNKTMIHRFSELYNPLFAAQSPIFGVRSPRESHDSFTFARLSEGRGITP